jgi:hypothetical protein
MILQLGVKTLDRKMLTTKQRISLFVTGDSRNHRLSVIKDKVSFYVILNTLVQLQELYSVNGDTTIIKAKKCFGGKRLWPICMN